jgi:uroporphyrinogen-III synthase
MSGLGGMRVVLLEARMSEELASIVRRNGGEPVCVPAVREAAVSATKEVSALVEALLTEPFSVVVFFTGVGVTALFRLADELGQREKLLEGLHGATLIARGPKPSGALTREGLQSFIRVKEPFTTSEVLDILAGLELTGRHTVLLHYGERNLPVIELLERKGARVREILLYEWKLPEDTEPLSKLVDEILAGKIGAIAFTSQVQVRHLLQVSEMRGRRGALIKALRDRTIVAAVGPTCASALEQEGIPPQVVPQHPKMGQMVLDLVAHVSKQKGSNP